MIPAVLLGGEHNPIIRRKHEGSLGRKPGERIVGPIAAVPDLSSLARRGIRDPDRPRYDASRNQGHFFLDARHADKRDLPPIRRPAGIEVAIDAGREVTHGVAPEIINCDEVVIFAMADKSDLPSIARPLGFGILAADIGQLVSRRCSRDRRYPQLLARGPYRKLAVRREFDIFAALLAATHLAKQTRSLAVRVHGP